MKIGDLVETRREKNVRTEQRRGIIIRKHRVPKITRTADSDKFEYTVQWFPTNLGRTRCEESILNLLAEGEVYESGV